MLRITFILCITKILTFGACAAEWTFPIPIPQEHREVETGRKANDGWGLFSFMVTAEGEVEDIVLLDSGGDPFNLGKMRLALSNTRFKPATKDGVSIAMPRTQFKKFSVINARKPNAYLGESFMEIYQEVMDAIRAKNLKLAKEKRDLLEENFNQSFAQNSWLAWVTAILNYQRQEWGSYLRNLSVATTLSTYNMEPNTRTRVHNNYFEALMHNHHYQDALSLAWSIQGDKELAFPDGYADEMVERAEQALHDTGVLSREITFSGEFAWTARVQRKTMIIEKLSGYVKQILLRCAGINKRWEEDTVFPLRVTPESEFCSIIIFADRGSKLSITESENI